MRWEKMVNQIANLEHKLLVQIEKTAELRLNVQHKDDALQLAKATLLAVSDYFEKNPTSGDLPSAIRRTIIAIIAAQDGGGFE